MTRKDYDLIANTLLTARREMERLTLSGTADRLYALDRTAELFAETLKATNPRFDQKRFLIACGTV